MSVIAAILLLYTLTVRPIPVLEQSPAQQPQRTLDEPPQRYRGNCDYQPVRVVAVAQDVVSTDGQSRYSAAHVREIDLCAVIASKTIWCAVGLIDAVFSVELLSRDTSNGFPDASRRSRMVSVVDVRDGLSHDVSSWFAVRNGTAATKAKPAFRSLIGLTKDCWNVKNAWHTPVAMLAHCRVVLTDSHLRSQGTDTVHGSYIGTLLPIQSYLNSRIRGPPLLANRDILTRVPRTKKPQKGLQSLLRLSEV